MQETVTPPLEATIVRLPIGPRCGACGAAVVEDQGWCVECGTALDRIGRRRWLTPAAVVGGVLALALVGTAIALAAIANDGPKDVVVAENPPPKQAVLAPAPPAAAVPAAPAPAPAKAAAPKKPPKTSSSSTPAAPPSSSSSSSSSSSGSTGSSGTSGSTATEPSTAASIPVTLDGDPAGDYDPGGDGAENPGQISNLTDKDRATTWTTAEYPSGSVGRGVGVYLRAASPVAASFMQVRTPQPGFSVEILASHSVDPPASIDDWHKVGSQRNVQDKDRVAIDAKGQRYRLYLLLITHLAGGRTSATISELELFS